MVWFDFKIHFLKVNPYPPPVRPTDPYERENGWPRISVCIFFLAKTELTKNDSSTTWFQFVTRCANFFLF